QAPRSHPRQEPGGGRIVRWRSCSKFTPACWPLNMLRAGWPDVVVCAINSVPLLTSAAMSTNPSLTAYVAEFITRTRTKDIPAEVMHLGKRSILDGVGLALAGSVAESGHIVRKYLRSLGCATTKGSTVIGSSMKLPACFAAFANGVAIHADDYDDTQLAVA